MQRAASHEDRLKPNAAEWDEKKIFPVDVLKESAALGFRRHLHPR